MTRICFVLRLGMGAAALVLLLARVVAAAPAVHVDFVILEEASTSYGTAASAFKRLVETQSGGGVGVSLHTDGRWEGRTLEDLDLVTAVRAGRMQMALVSSAPLSNLSPALEVLNDPFLFRDYAEVHRVLDGPLGQLLLDSPVSQGLRGLAFLDGGFRLFACTRPIRSLADFRGLRVRTLQNRTFVSLVKAFQGVPVPAAIRKIRAMVARGFIDAADRSYPTYGSLDLYDVLPFITETHHAYAAKVLIVNEAFLASLAPARRALIVRAARETARRQFEAFRQEAETVRRRALARGVRILRLTATERAAFEAASRPVRDEVSRVAGAGLVARVRSAAAGR